MSKIKLTGENSGYVEISAGQNAGNNTLELPTSGTKVVASDDSGNVNNLGIVTATTFSGNLTGNVTGNVTGNLTGNVNASGNSTFDGSVGIGTNTPTQKLEVYGGKIFIDGGGNRKITLDPGSNTTYEPRIDASHDLVFRSYVDSGPGVKTCTFNSNGDLDLTQGRNLKFASGNGIDFSATADASGSTSELLDDYEEGTWTPTIRLDGGTAAGTTVSPESTVYKGRYVKIGDMVFVEAYGRYNFSTLTGTWTATVIQGLPYTQGNQNSQQYAGVHIGYLSNFYSGFPTTNNNFPGGYVRTGQSDLVLTINNPNGGETTISNSVLSGSASAGIMFSAYYRDSDSG